MAQQALDRGAGDLDPEPAQFASNALVAPRRILPGQPLDQGPSLEVEARPSCTVRIRPLPSGQPPVPAQQRILSGSGAVEDCVSGLAPRDRVGHARRESRIRPVHLASPPHRAADRPVLDRRFGDLGIVALEVGIAVAMLGGRRIRRWALVAGITLHAAIVIAMGLFSFGTIMIGVLLIASGGTRMRPDQDLQSKRTPDVEIETEPPHAYQR